MQHYYAFVIINIDEPMRKKISEIIESERIESEKLKAKLEKMTLDESLIWWQNRKPSEYGKLLYGLEQKVKKPLQKYAERKFNSWTPRGIFTPETLLKDFETSDYFPEAIMTSDCRWLERGWDENDKKDDKLYLEWEQLVRKTLNENKEKSVVLLINYDS